jgi:hypothetical protein
MHRSVPVAHKTEYPLNGQASTLLFAEKR